MSITTVTIENFQHEVLECEKTVLVDFWAPWCGPCRNLAPVIDELAEELTDVKVGKINVDEEVELARAFGISSIPAVFVVKDGKVCGQSLGFVPKEKLLALL